MTKESNNTNPKQNKTTKAKNDSTIINLPIFTSLVVFFICLFIGLYFYYFNGLANTNLQNTSQNKEENQSNNNKEQYEKLLRITNGNPPLVSVITPTQHTRQIFHNRLFLCFDSQTYPNKELIVLESGPKTEKSSFFSSLKDNRVKYLFETVSTGEKRNKLVKASNGEIIAHFDDDDYYSPEYLMTMVIDLIENKAELTKLSGFFFYSPNDKFFGYWNQNQSSELLKGSKVSILLARDTGTASLMSNVFPSTESHFFGFGFTYVYTKKLFETVSGFPDKPAAEDYPFVESAKNKKLKVRHFIDEKGIALKLFHQKCSSNLLSQYRLPSFTLEPIFGSNISNYLT
eukprot:c11570_g1_i1.p1 GENE.c11570_g1_i1~~c11570_g1_i1.p1  ORF type:complete len:351 (+),score=103.33 c11570_g1_i1:23-1054(+)